MIEQPLRFQLIYDECVDSGPLAHGCWSFQLEFHDTLEAVEQQMTGKAGLVLAASLQEVNNCKVIPLQEIASFYYLSANSL